MNKLFFGAFLFLAILTSTNLHSQDYKFGIRAGLNYSKLLGPQINELTHQDYQQFNNGIHFGVTFSYYLTDNFGFRTELAYNQIGTRYTFESESAPYVFRYGLNREPRNGKIKRYLDINNSYIHVPLMAFVKPFKKIEVFGGVYAQFLILPTSDGNIDFTAPENPDTPGELYRYSFIQFIEGNYYSDEARNVKGNQTLIVDLIIDGESEQVSMNRLVGAYYELDEDEKTGSTFNWFDMGIEGGVSYNINRSLYVGLTGMYGLLDVTNDKMDVDYFNLDEFQKYKFRDDFDTNLSLQLSLGFKF